MRLDTMKELLVEQLKDLYDAEHRISKALPAMAASASNEDLREAFNNHLTETHEHIKRLEECFTKLGIPAEREECEATRGLIEEGEEVIHSTGDQFVKDAALIAAAQRVEHYEMAGYGSARSIAKHAGFEDVADVLQKTLDEEGEADKKLTTIACGGWFTSGINQDAVAN